MLEEVKCERLEEIAINGNPEKFFQVGAQLPPREKEELLAFLRRNIDAVSEEAKCERLEEIAIDGNPKKFFQVRTQLPLREKEELLAFLRRNIDVFAWNAYKAPGVDPYFICHHLNVNLVVLSRKQPPRCSSKEHSDAIKEKVNKLKQAGAIKEVFYPEWLANTVVVKKNEKWQVCVDFTDLNKACPKDPFPMSRIDQLVDVIIGHPQMSFLDAFQGYRQIRLALEDQENTIVAHRFL